MNVLKRGEVARALEWLWFVQRYLLQLIRINEGKTEYWVNPTKNLEHVGQELIDQLRRLYKLNAQEDLLKKLEEYFAI